MRAKIEVNCKAILTGHHSSVYSLTKGPGNLHFFSSDGSGWIVSWDLEQGTNGTLFAQMQKPVYSICYSPEHKLLWAGTMNGDIARIDEDRNTRVFKAHSGPVFGFTQTGQDTFISFGGDGKLIFWNQDGTITNTIHHTNAIIRSVIAAARGLFIGVTGGMLYSCNMDGSDFKEVHKFEGTIFSIEAANTDNTYLAAGRDALIYAISPGNDTILESTIPAHLQSIHCLKSNKVQWLGSSSMDKTIKIWDLQSLELLKVIDKVKFGIHSSSVNHLLWLNPNILVSASDDRQIGVFEINSAE